MNHPRTWQRALKRYKVLLKLPKQIYILIKLCIKSLIYYFFITSFKLSSHNHFDYRYFSNSFSLIFNLLAPISFVRSPPFTKSAIIFIVFSLSCAIPCSSPRCNPCSNPCSFAYSCASFTYARCAFQPSQALVYSSNMALSSLLHSSTSSILSAFVIMFPGWCVNGLFPNNSIQRTLL